MESAAHGMFDGSPHTAGGDVLSRSKGRMAPRFGERVGWFRPRASEAGMPKRAPKEGFTASLGRNYPARTNSIPYGIWGKNIYTASGDSQSSRLRSTFGSTVLFCLGCQLEVKSGAFEGYATAIGYFFRKTSCIRPCSLASASMPPTFPPQTANTSGFNRDTSPR